METPYCTVHSKHFTHKHTHTHTHTYTHTHLHPLTHHRLGSWVDPLDTVENGSQHQHAVRDGVSYQSLSSPTTRFFAIDTLDAPVVVPATLAQPADMFPCPLTPLTGPVVGFDVQLMQNAFSTNTPLVRRHRVGVLAPFFVISSPRFCAVHVGPCV
jgi:hypothetical protein